MSKQIEAIYLESCEQLEGLRKECYDNLSLDQSLLLRTLESKIEKDLEQIPSSFYKNLIIQAAVKDAFSAIYHKYITELPEVENGSELAFSNDFNYSQSLLYINEAFTTESTELINRTVNSETAKIIASLLCCLTNSTSCMHYYLTFIKYYSE
jgi:hypothetical protein